MLHAVANAIGLSDPLRLKLWSVTGESDLPQPFHTPYILNEFHLRNKAFDGHALKLEGAKKYGSNGVIFYEVVPFSIVELRDHVAMELEVSCVRMLICSVSCLHQFHIDRLLQTVIFIPF